jgi:hypothetical protein
MTGTLLVRLCYWIASNSIIVADEVGRLGTVGNAKTIVVDE